MGELEQIKTIIKDYYEILHTELFPASFNYSELQIYLNDDPCGYDCKNDVIHIRYAEGNLFDDLNNDPSLSLMWPWWQSMLVHEMIHEYQYKIKPPVTVTGKLLFSRYQLNESTPKSHESVMGFPGPGHNDVFYTSLVLFADHFKKVPHEFIKLFI